jgi:peptidoglycan/LPS O-acetylase OafA/YrhL
VNELTCPVLSVNRNVVPEAPKMEYRADIDGLRAVAVLSVVAFHAFPEHLRGGFVGVDIFFVISGFLISSIIFTNLDKGSFSFSEFYKRRIKRIFPALILVLLACLAFGWIALLRTSTGCLANTLQRVRASRRIFSYGGKPVTLMPHPNANRCCISGRLESKSSST